MSDQDAFERILASLYEAMLDDAQWPATSALIDEACGLLGNALLVRDGPQDAGQVPFFGLYYRGERRADWEREYLTVYHPIDECVPRSQQQSDSRLVHLTDLYTPEELKTSRTYNEILAQGNAQDSVNVRLDGPSGSHIHWRLWRLGEPVAPGGWEAPQLALLKGLLPHIRQFVRVRQALVGAAARGAAMTELLNTSRMGVIHLNRHGRIMETNDRAQAILHRRDGMADRDGFLRARTSDDQARLERLLAGALPTSGVAAVSGSMTVRRPSALLPFVVHVNPVGSQQPDFGAQQVAVLVLIVEPGRPPRIDPGLVAEVFGFTLAESQVAVWVAEGQTVRQIVEATGRTESTIRYHLNQMSQKQGLSRQADVVRLVLSLVEGL